MSAYVWSEKESRKTQAARRKANREAKAAEEEELVEAICGGAEPPPFALLPRETEISLDIPDGCAGMIIGKKGENLRNLMSRHKVTVNILDVGEDGAVQARSAGRTPGTKQRVVVSGMSAHAVETVARELDFATDEVEVPTEMIGWAIGRGGKYLKFIQELSGVAFLQLRREGDAVAPDAEGEDADDLAPVAEEEEESPLAGADRRRVWVQLRGRRESVEDARMCLEAHLGYHPVYVEMSEAEAELDKEIADAQAMLGLRGRRQPAQGGTSGTPSASDASPAAKGRGAGRGAVAKGRGRAREAGASNSSKADAGSGRGRGRGAKA